MRILEVGPDSHPTTFECLVGNPTIRWETLDIAPERHPTYLADGEYRFPVADETFDVVFSSQVIEHVRKVWLWVPELARVCKAGGHVITINPVSWPYHEAPVDCWRIYPEGMRALYEEAGLTVEYTTCESLEIGSRSYRRLIPGVSAQQGIAGIIKRLIKLAIGWPIVCAFDVITIGTKPARWSRTTL
jgi:SAM-dependent methyltransferase